MLSMSLIVQPVILVALVRTLSPSALPGVPPASDRMTNEQRDSAVRMLERVRDVVKDNYYDPGFHGVDLKGRCEAAKERLAKVTTLSEAYGLAAWLLEPLNDSHTVFLPPSRPYRIENGWRMNFFGERCYLTAVQAGSDAAAQGLKPGDQMLGMEGFRMERNSAWKLEYSFEALAPRSAMHLIVAAPNGAPRELLVKANVQKLPKVLDLEFDWRDPDAIRMQESQVVEFGDKVMVWKFPGFSAENREIDRFIAKANKHEALILDLRRNPGGAESTLAHLVSSVVAHDVQIGEHVGRSPKKPMMAKAEGTNKRFSGTLIVLVDSGSASAAEIFARVIQIEKRGPVLGDHSSGRVMEARIYYSQVGELFGIPFGVEVATSDLIMADGKSLEHTGVTPDQIILPSAEDLAAGRDPVLSRAANLAGVELTPEKAGQVFPAIWLALK